MERNELYKTYLSLIIEPALKYYEYFYAFIESLNKDKLANIKIKIDKKLCKRLFMETLVYSLAITEFLSFKRIDSDMRKQAIDECFKQLFPDIIDHNFNKPKVNRMEFEDFCLGRYQEYGALLTKSKEKFQLLFTPIGAKNENFDDPIFRSTVRCLGIIKCLINGQYDIPGIEPGPFVWDRLTVAIPFTSFLDNFLRKVIGEAVIPGIFDCFYKN